MADLSPAAQAVLDAALGEAGPAFEPLVRVMAAAALQAAANVSRRGSEHWLGTSPDDYDNGWDAALDYIIDLVTELENHQ